MLKSILLRISFIIFLTLSSFSSWSQCCCATNLGNISPSMNWQFFQHSCMGYVAFPAQAGCTYVFTYCNSIAPSAYYSGDPYLTINSFNPMSGAVAANDDYCGLGSYISWTAPATQTYYLQMGNWAQGATCACGQNRNLGYRSTNCVAGVQPPSGITASAMSVCQGQPVTLTATGTMGTQYWYTGSCGGNQIGTGASISVTPTTTTTYYVNNNSGGQFSPSCASVTITVNPSPPAPTVSGNLTICGSGSTTLTASGGSGNYIWYSNAAATNQLTTTAAYTTPILTTTTTYYLTSTSAPPNQVPGLWTFTPCGAAGTVGPTQAQCNGVYGPGVVQVTGIGTQRWIVPQSGMYTITAKGASGGNANIAIGGQGRVIQIQVALTAGHQIGMIVGQQGGQLQFNTGYAGGGGGGTFVYNYTTNQPILVCGGGGGAGKGSPSWNYITNGGDAAPYNSTNGMQGLATPGSWCAVGAAGTGGGGGGGGNGGSGGGGLNGNGTQSTYGGAVGQSFNSGGSGGTHTMYTGGVTSNAPGGFGGGAGAGGHNNYEANGGGGGGYSGGGGAACRVGGGGGGGNFFTGTYISNSLHTGNGEVVIAGGIAGGVACLSPIIPVTVIVNPQPTITATGATICAGQSATLTANPNIPGGTCVWMPGNLQGTSITVNPVTTTIYTVTYTTAGCAGVTATATVTVNPLQPITGNLTICQGSTTQLSNPVAPSGTPWMSSNTAVATISPSGLVTGLSAGTTTITYSSSNGCQATAIVTVDGTPLLTVTPNNIACFGGSGSVTLSASGGTAPFTYGATPTTNLAPGSYTYVATSAAGCVSLPVTITIIQPQVGLTVTTTQTNVLCFGNNTGAINATPAGGSAPYTYSWSNGATTQNLTALPSGSYTVTVTDANGCTATATVIITQPAAALAATTTQVNILCLNGVGSINLTVSGGTLAYSYLWSNQVTTEDLANLQQGTYTVTVTDANGCTTTASAIILQTLSQVPVAINNLSGTTVLTCASPIINLQATGGVTYTWTGGSSVSTAANSFTLPGQYTVNMIDPNGCPVSQNITLTQNVVLPPVQITNNSGATVIDCNNATINLSASGGGQYAWNNGLGSLANVSIAAAGTYTVVVTAANGCVDSSTVVVTLAPVPLVTAGDTTICSGQSVTLSPTYFPGGLGGSVIWSSGQQTPTITVSPTTTTTYSILYTWNGCPATQDVTVTVNATPTVQINNSTICLGDNAQMTATPNQVGGTYLWTPGGETTSSISVSPVSNSTYGVVYTLNGCPSGPASGTVSVNPIPVLVVNAQTICEGQSGTLTATPDLPGGSYLWTSTGETTPSITVSPQVDTSYSVSYTLNGCVSNVAQGQVSVNPLPTASFIADTLSGCAPLTVLFTADTSNQIASYQWLTSSGASGVGNQSSLTFLTTGCYDITLTATMNGCTNASTSNGYICVQEIPTANFSTSVNDFTQPNESVTFINTSNGASSYIWNFGDGSLGDEMSPTHLYSGTNNGYTATLIAITSMGCIDSTSITIGYEETASFYIPNTFTPDGDKYNQTFRPVFTSGIDYQNYGMYIYNRWGEMVFETHDVAIGWDGSYGTEGLDAQAGVYTYQILVKIPETDERKIIAGHVNLLR